MVTIKANNTLLPSPAEIDATDELIWSADTGRSASGKMLGTVIAQKQTFNIRWGVLTKAELQTIRTNLKAGFYPFEINIDGERVSIQSYRGALSCSVLGTFGGVTYYNNAAVTIIQQ